MPPAVGFPDPGSSSDGEESSLEITERDVLLKRAMASSGADTNWHLSQICAAPEMVFNVDDDAQDHHPNLQDPTQGKFAWAFDDSLGKDQTIYIMEGGNMPSHPVSVFFILLFHQRDQCTSEGSNRK